MSQEQMKVLQMLDEGKITAEEATTLLQKLSTTAKAEAPADNPWAHWQKK